MATVRKNRGVWVADFRDQHGQRRIETPKGHFETKELQKRAARELLNKRLLEVDAHCFTASRQRMTFEHLAETWISSKVRIGDTTLVLGSSITIEGAPTWRWVQGFRIRPSPGLRDPLRAIAAENLMLPGVARMPEHCRQSTDRICMNGWFEWRSKCR